MATLQELGFEFLPHPPHSPDLAPNDFFLLYKRILAGKKKISADEEVIAETEAYFETKKKLFNKNGIEKLYDRYNCFIALEGNHIK